MISNISCCFYQVTGVLEKNSDGLKPDLEAVIASCDNKVSATN